MQVARRLRVSRPTVVAWRERYRAGGREALRDAPRSGWPRTVDEDEIVARTLEPPPAALAVTHWSSRLLAAELGLGDATVARCWRRLGLQPWRRETFKFSTDPELEAKVRDVIGLYLDPPQKAVVLCVDENSQIQALDRSAPILPLRPGLPEKATHDYVRPGARGLRLSLGTALKRCSNVTGREPVGLRTKLDSDAGGYMMPVSWEGMSVWWIAAEVQRRHRDRI